MQYLFIRNTACTILNLMWCAILIIAWQLPDDCLNTGLIIKVIKRFLLSVNLRDNWKWEYLDGQHKNQEFESNRYLVLKNRRTYNIGTQVIFPSFEYTPKRYITYVLHNKAAGLKEKKICTMCLCKNYLVFSCIKFKANIKWWNKMKLERILSETNFPDSSNSSLEQPVLVHCLLCLSF